MLPEICRIGNFTVYSYGLMLVLAFFVCAYLSTRQAKKEGADAEKIFNLFFYVFIFGIIGSRIFYILLNVKFYLNNPLEIIMFQHGGMAWFGGLIFGSGTAFLFIKKHKLDLLKTLDLMAPFIALGQSIGRIGCLLNGCCFGRESEFGLYFKTFDQILIPTQLYSSLLLLLIFIILRYRQDHLHLPGEILCGYLFLYSLKRFFIEFLRNDSPRIFYGLTFFQLLCLAVFLISLGIFIKLILVKKK
ncbi:MAG TPA: prolipoprotein diacylglyceryl transferase [Candidatus Omnitrophota bacterium]|nr:prolipoprotein diacylglyceryl transferase [Candidatus Omnitrophota bacterium]HPT39791.1 prolipoprotein diacylglyceryl transferase [Candidatus Omnitrophota bacterium]